MSQLGRISGPLLVANLLRDNRDLAFETSLLYLKVTNNRIGVNKTNPSVDLDVNDDIRTTNLITTGTSTVDGIIVNNNLISTQSLPLNLRATAHDPVFFHDRMRTSRLEIDDNFISNYDPANPNIILDPNGSGIIDVQATTNVTGDTNVSGNIVSNGNVTLGGTITIGDRILDTITINTDFTQSIVPGDNGVWSLGENTGDSSPRRWSEMHSPDWTNITNIIAASSVVSNQLLIDGVNNKISAIQSNEDVLLNPDTGIVYIEKTKWQDNDITNLLNTPITLASTNDGYYTISNTETVMIIPAGTTAEQPVGIEVGATRWNTTEQYLETWDGTQWNLAAGGGGNVTVNDAEDLGFINSVILG